jgi:hypothetical protein
MCGGLTAPLAARRSLVRVPKAAQEAAQEAAQGVHHLLKARLAAKALQGAKAVLAANQALNLEVSRLRDQLVPRAVIA